MISGYSFFFPSKKRKVLFAKKRKVFICVLIFYFIFYSDKSSKRARDLHLLKKLKTILKENTEESG